MNFIETGSASLKHNAVLSIDFSGFETNPVCWFPSPRPSTHPYLWHHNFFLPFICLWTALCSLSINKSLNDVCFLPLTSCFSSDISLLLYILLGPALYILLLLFKEPATSRRLSVLGLGSHVWCFPLLSLLCSQLWWYGSFGAPWMFVLSNTIEHNNGTNQPWLLMCAWVFSLVFLLLQKLPSEIILGDEKEQTVCVSDLQGQSGCSTGIVCAVRQRGRVMKSCTSSWREASASCIYDLGNTYQPGNWNPLPDAQREGLSYCTFYPYPAKFSGAAEQGNVP